MGISHLHAFPRPGGRHRTRGGVNGASVIRAIAAALALLATPVLAESWTFEGRIEAAHRAVLSSQLDGIVAEVLFAGGEWVEPGAAMIRLDPADAKLDLAAAEAAQASATAELALARQEAERARSLRKRGVATPAQLQSAEAALSRAEAEMARADVDLARAKLTLERTVIRAPIAGFASAPSTAPGAFLEAESGAPLGQIVALDPVILAYRVPYATRLQTLAETGAPNLAALFDRIALTLVLPGDTHYPHQPQPDHASALVDPADGTITVRAFVPNPEGLLRPGMALTVHSRITATDKSR